jgi:DNA-binding CsgD family transcriptional regulator
MDHLSELLVDGYQHVVESNDWDCASLSEATGASPESVKEVQQILASLQVIERDADRDGWRALSPRAALTKLVAPIEADARRRAAYAEDLRSLLETLLPIHETKQRSEGTAAFEAVADDAALLALIEQGVAGCVEEMSVMQRRADPAAATLQRRLRLYRRGVRIRTVFQHAARYHIPSQGLLDGLGATGIEVRTTGELPLQLYIFDRTTCILMVDTDAADALEPDRGPGGTDVAVITRHPSMVSMMVNAFEGVWTRGAPYARSDPQPAWIADDLRKSIMKLLAGGAKDELVARRLGISVRTCRRHVADLMKTLDATSRFQAGFEAHRRKLI